MEFLVIILILFFLFSLIFNYLSLTSKKTSIQIVNEMGIGYNLGYSFDCFDISEKIEKEDDLITLCGNPIPTKKTIVEIKKNGFKTIRFPITWLHFIDELGTINSHWMHIIKEIVDWIIKENMYCIINIYNDGLLGNWLYEGVKAKNKYIYLWSQIANEFKDYDELLIFESMDDLEIIKFSLDFGFGYDYESLNILTQSFVDTIRNSGGKNSERLLLIAGANNQLDLTCSSKYKIPIDPNNKLAISMHYYIPFEFTSTIDNEFYWYDENGNEHLFKTLRNWGTEVDYNEIITNFELIKKYFVDKGIPVILGEVGVLTEYKKDIISIREYLYAVFSMSSDYNGIMSCLWDTSNKTIGDMNFMNRENYQWYDTKIKNNFKKISKGKYIKPKDYFIYTNSITTTTLDSEDNMNINIGNKKIIKIIFNIKINEILTKDIIIHINTCDKNGYIISYIVGQNYGKKQYDGSYTFTLEVKDKDLNEVVQVDKLYNDIDITINYLTVIFEEQFLSIDKNSYKSAISNFIQ